MKNNQYRNGLLVVAVLVAVSAIGFGVAHGYGGASRHPENENGGGGAVVTVTTPTPSATPAPSVSPTPTPEVLGASTVVADPANLAKNGLHEGQLISAVGFGDPDVYVVNSFGYKRLFLNPVIFGFYGNLGTFASVKHVSIAVRDSFPTSLLVRNCESNNPKVYAMDITGEDTGTLHWINLSGNVAVSQDASFFQKVFCINNNEFNWYTTSGTDFTSLTQVSSYHR